MVSFFLNFSTIPNMLHYTYDIQDLSMMFHIKEQDVQNPK